MVFLVLLYKFKNPHFGYFHKPCVIGRKNLELSHMCKGICVAPCGSMWLTDQPHSPCSGLAVCLYGNINFTYYNFTFEAYHSA